MSFSDVQSFVKIRYDTQNLQCIMICEWSILRYIFVHFVRELGRYGELRVKILHYDVVHDYKALEIYLVSIGHVFVKFECFKF